MQFPILEFKLPTVSCLRFSKLHSMVHLEFESVFSNEGLQQPSNLEKATKKATENALCFLTAKVDDGPSEICITLI